MKEATELLDSFLDDSSMVPIRKQQKLTNNLFSAKKADDYSKSKTGKKFMQAIRDNENTVWNHPEKVKAALESGNDLGTFMTALNGPQPNVEES